MTVRVSRAGSAYGAVEHARSKLDPEHAPNGLVDGRHRQLAFADERGAMRYV